MKFSLASIVAGLVCILGAVSLNAYHRRAHESDLRGIAELRGVLDSTRLGLAAAATATDSARLAEEIRSREYFLSRREYHVPLRQAGLENWWKRTGRGTMMVTVGALLVAVGFLVGGLAALRRRPAGG